MTKHLSRRRSTDRDTITCRPGREVCTEWRDYAESLGLSSSRLGAVLLPRALRSAKKRGAEWVRQEIEKEATRDNQDGD